MPSFCVVSNCEFKYNQSENVSFHKFPQNSDLRKKWIEFTERINWEPSRWSTICSRHFKPIDFKNVNISRKSLKKNALPTVKSISSQEQANNVNEHNGSNDETEDAKHMSNIPDKTFIRTTESDSKNQELKNQNIKIESIIPVSSGGNISNLTNNETVGSNSTTFTTVHSVQQMDIINSAASEISGIPSLTAKVTSSEILPRSANQNYLQPTLKNQVSSINENCRLCSNPFTVNDSLESFGSNLEIFRMLQKCFPTLNIQQDDSYPKKICNLCLEKLEDFSEFTDLVINSQQKFVQFEKIPSSRNERIKIKQEPIVRVKQEKAESSANELGDSEKFLIQKENSEKIDIIPQSNQNEDSREMNTKDYSHQQLCQQQSDSEFSCDQKSSQFFDFSILNDDMDILEIISLDGGFIDIDEMTNDGDNDDNDSIIEKNKRIKINEELLFDSSPNANLSQQSLSSCNKEQQMLNTLNKIETEYKDNFDTKENLYAQNEDIKHFRKDSDRHFLDPLRIANEHNYTKIYEGDDCSYKIEQPENEDLEYFSQKEIIDLAQDIKPISSNLDFSPLITHDSDQNLKSKNFNSDKNEEHCDLISTIHNDISKSSTQISQNEVNNNISSQSYYSNIQSSEDSSYFTSLIMRDFSTYPPISVSSNLNFPVTSLGQTFSQLNFTALENHPIFPEILNSNSKQNSQKSSIVVLNESILKPCNLMHKCFQCNSQFFTKENLSDHQNNVHKTQLGKNFAIINLVAESGITNNIHTINQNTGIQNEIQERNEIKKKDESKANVLHIDRKTFEPNCPKELEVGTTEVETIPIGINHHYQEQQSCNQEQTKNLNLEYDEVCDTETKVTNHTEMKKLVNNSVEILPPTSSSQILKYSNSENWCTLQKQSLIFSCTMCLSSFESKLALNNHRKYLCRFNQSIEFYCKYCNLNLQKWVECRQHEKKCRLLQPPVPRQERKKHKPIKETKNLKKIISIRNEVEAKIIHLVLDSDISSNNENIYCVKDDHLPVENDNLIQPDQKLDINNFNSKTELNQELDENNITNNFHYEEPSSKVDTEKFKNFQNCNKAKTNIKDFNELTEESRELIENLQLLKETPINRNYSGLISYFDSQDLCQKKTLHDSSENINKPLNYYNISNSDINPNIYLNNQLNTKIYLKLGKRNENLTSNELLSELENNNTEKVGGECNAKKNRRKYKSYTCQICDKDFKALGNLYQHKKTHSNVRKYKCELCGNKDKYFKRLNGLNQHLRGYHQGLRPFACSKCGHCFALKTDAARCRHSKFKKTTRSALK